MSTFFEKIVALLDVWGYLLFQGTLVTLGLFASALALQIALALVVGLGLISRNKIVRILCSTYVEIFRGLSTIVILFWAYYALPFLGVKLSAWTAAVLGLALSHSAYMAEYIRSTIQAVPKGQYEAARVLGMNDRQRMRYIIFPQALAAIMPLFGNELVMLLKATSYASLITLSELTEAGRSIVVRTFDALPAFLIVLTIYYLIAQALIFLNNLIEFRISFWRTSEGIDRANAKRNSRLLKPKNLEVRR